MKLMGGAMILAGALLTNTAPVLAQDPAYAGGYNYAPAGQLDSLVSRIGLYPDPLLAQVFAAAAFPDQIAAAAQGSGGPFDPSVEALMQYPSVLQMMASDPAWTQALGQAVMQDQGAVMDAIQNLRQEAQQYGYLQSGPQMQVVNNAGYIDIEPVGGYMYVPVYDPYVVFAQPRPGFFVSGAIRFGGGFHWAGVNDRFNWRSHQVVVNLRVWTPPVHRMVQPAPHAFEPGRPVTNRQNFAPDSRGWNRTSTAPAMQPPVQRNFVAPQQMNRDAGRPMEQRNFTAPQPQPQQRSFVREQPRQMAPQNFTAPRQMEQRSFAAQPRNEGGHFDRGGEGRGRGR
jgi:hypothetical protein